MLVAFFKQIGCKRSAFILAIPCALGHKPLFHTHADGASLEAHDLPAWAFRSGSRISGKPHGVRFRSISLQRAKSLTQSLISLPNNHEGVGVFLLNDGFQNMNL